MHDQLADQAVVVGRDAIALINAAVDPDAEAAGRIGEKLPTVQQWGKAGREPRNTMPTRIIMTLVDRYDAK